MDTINDHIGINNSFIMSYFFNVVTAFNVSSTHSDISLLEGHVV